MAQGLFMVVLFGVVMAIASFGAGMLPLAISLSQNQIRLLSTIGMGVLVGTSLIVIIPEGIETLYSVPPTKAVARTTSSIGTPPPADAASGRFGVDLNDRDIPVLPAWIVPRSAAAVAEAQIDSLPIPPPPTVVEAAAPHDDHSDSDSDDDDDDHHDDDDDHGHETNGAHRWIGLSLISGFILMYLIDVLPNARSNADNQQPYHIALDNLRSISPPPASAAAGAAKPNAITLGLVIHAAADGIALGASSTAESVRLSAIIFLAIMLHKAPAAFGLTAVLLRSGMAKKSARNHLLVFSLAAPTGALVTWALVTMLGGSGAGMQWWTGVLLLFSGGTFLYVAMHTMQDHLTEYGHTNGIKDVGAAVFGMMIPLVTQIGHHH